MSPPIEKSNKNGGGIKGLVFGPGGAAMLAGIIEISVFHPFDTCSKRLMKNTRPIFVSGDAAATRQNLKNVVFAGMKVPSPAGGGATIPYEQLAAATATSSPSSAAKAADVARAAVPFRSYVSYLYPGSIYAVYYKVSQRFIKFAGQPYVKDWMQQYADNNANANANNNNDSNNSINKNKDTSPRDEARKARRRKLFFEAAAGSLVGMGEVVLLPIDRMKVLSQTNAQTLAGRSMLSVVASEGVRKMYAAAGTTVVRNCIGSFLLFGGSALTKEVVFGLEDYRKASVAQNLFASGVGATMGVLATSPMDVVKTRLQSRNLVQQSHAATTSSSSSSPPPPTALRVVADTLKTEGPRAFFKGITPKIITTAPKLIFSYTFTLYCTEQLRRFAGTSTSTTASSSKPSAH